MIDTLVLDKEFKNLYANATHNYLFGGFVMHLTHENCADYTELNSYIDTFVYTPPSSILTNLDIPIHFNYDMSKKEYVLRFFVPTSMENMGNTFTIMYFDNYKTEGGGIYPYLHGIFNEAESVEVSDKNNFNYGWNTLIVPNINENLVFHQIADFSEIVNYYSYLAMTESLKKETELMNFLLRKGSVQLGEDDHVSEKSLNNRLNDNLGIVGGLLSLTERQ